MYPVELSPYSFALSSIDSEKITLTLGNFKTFLGIYSKYNQKISFYWICYKIFQNNIFGSSTVHAIYPNGQRLLLFLQKLSLL